MLLRTRILKLHSFFVLIRNHKLNIWRNLKHKQIFRKQGKEHVLNIAPTCFLLLLNVYILMAYCNTNLFINIFLFKRHSLPFVLYAYFQPPTFLGRIFWFWKLNTSPWYKFFCVKCWIPTAKELFSWYHEKKNENNESIKRRMNIMLISNRVRGGCNINYTLYGISVANIFIIFNVNKKWTKTVYRWAFNLNVYFYSIWMIYFSHFSNP